MIEVETISGQLVVTRVNAAANHDIHPGDTITHVNGRAAVDRNAISGIFAQVFYRVNADYNSDSDESRICRWLSIDVKKGDVVQIMSQDDNWIQARKVNDLSRVGYLPASLSKEKVAMLCPFGRRVLVLLGAVGVGRRTLKSMLLRAAPQYFATVVPREQEGREYNFVTKEEMLRKIREGGMVEWGELDGQLYGTCADSVRSVVRSGRMCVLDCAPQALSHLYNSEFMPFVVHIIPPQLEEFLQLENLRHHRRPVDQLSKVCAESDQIANGPHADQIHLTLMNRNLDVTFKR
ncbi:SH3 domain protein [Teladorsagia circumcincta]|uniref:SH3 domain protein n=1 Tax=Teladorsagia circumcincta TaxID=45464 RepID=A0A2G9UTM5_TELCI|nr:SH3 domain protein [Teladorsagia circumcincta]